eukprot:629680_1
MRNPTEIEYFPDTSKYMNAMEDELRSITHLPPVIPIVSIRCWVYGVIALDCSGSVYQWGESLTEGPFSEGSDILCPQQIKLEEKVVSIETGFSHCICRTERGHFISIGSGYYGECCRDQRMDFRERKTSPQIINGCILSQVRSKERKILSAVPGRNDTFILVSK